MRQKRAKAYRKLMSLYCMTFGFRQPYQVLVDSEMCKTAIAHKLDFVKQLGIVLQGTVKPMITQCCIHELYLQGKSEQPTVDLAKTFERRKCNHREPIPGDDCLASVIGDTNKHRYVVATQSQPLRGKLRLIPAVPIVHITRSVMILEPPADATLRAKALAEQQTLLPSTSELKQLTQTSEPSEPPRKKRKGPKGANPLSVKKKKPKTAEPQAKARAATTASSSSKTQEAEAQVGQKRKAKEGETHSEGTEEGAVRKRKRRRKTATTHPSGDVAGTEL